MQPCPVCSKEFSLSEIEQHVNDCLDQPLPQLLPSESEKKQKEPQHLTADEATQLGKDIFEKERDKLCGPYACFNAFIPIIEKVYEILGEEEFPRWDLDQKWEEAVQKINAEDFTTNGITEQKLLNLYLSLVAPEGLLISNYELYFFIHDYQKCKDANDLVNVVSTILAGSKQTIAVTVVLGAGDHWFTIDSVDENTGLIQLTTYEQSYHGKIQILLKNEPNNERLKFIVENGRLFSFILYDRTLQQDGKHNPRKVPPQCKKKRKDYNKWNWLCDHNQAEASCTDCKQIKKKKWLVTTACWICRKHSKVKSGVCASCLHCASDGCPGKPSGVFRYEYCYPCGCVSIGKTPQKKRQDDVFEFIEKNYPECSVRYDKTLPDQDCNKFRPDVLFILPHRKLIIECDENSHKAETYSCESKRMSELASSGEILPTVFIRYNPDQYRSPNGKKKKIPKAERLQVLKEEIDKWIEVDTEQQHTFTVVYLFYDRCEQREEGFIPCDPITLS